MNISPVFISPFNIQIHKPQCFPWLYCSMIANILTKQGNSDNLPVQGSMRTRYALTVSISGGLQVGSEPACADRRLIQGSMPTGLALFSGLRFRTAGVFFIHFNIIKLQKLPLSARPFLLPYLTYKKSCLLTALFIQCFHTNRLNQYSNSVYMTLFSLWPTPSSSWYST